MHHVITWIFNIIFSDEGNDSFGESIKLMVFITQLALLVIYISHRNLVPANTFHCDRFCKASDCMGAVTYSRAGYLNKVSPVLNKTLLCKLYLS